MKDKGILFQITAMIMLAQLFIGHAAAQSSAAFTEIRVVEKQGATTASYPLTFGMVFKRGEITGSIELRDKASSTTLQTQVDVKRRYQDNSIRHAVITVLVPNLAANSERTLEMIAVSSSPNNTGFLDKSAILATGAQSEIRLSSLSGSGYSGSLTARLNQVVSASSSLSYWLQGALCTEIIVNEKLNNSLTAVWEARFYPGWNGIRISNTIENVEAGYRGNIDYAVSIHMGDNSNSLAQHYSKSTFQHNHSSRWRKVLWIGNALPEVELHYGLDYLAASGHIHNYDSTVEIPSDDIASRYSSWSTGEHDIMDSSYIQTYFPTTGGREDIGPLPAWTARYLLSMDNRLKEIMLNHAELASGIPIHYRESDSSKNFHGHIVSIDDRPTVWLGRNDYSWTDDNDRLPAAIGNEDTVWTVDRAHQASFAYIPYLITGERYYLDEMYYWAGYDLGASNYNSEWGRDRSEGLIRDQVRGEGWAIRVIAQAAALAPNADIEKTYLEEKIQNNINTWITETVSNPSAHTLHSWGSGSCWGEDGGRAYNDLIGCEQSRTGAGSGTNEHILPIRRTSSPWMDDFVLLSLCQMRDLGYSTGSLASWLGEYVINRFSHPDVNAYHGAAYRYPYSYVSNVNTSSPDYAVTSWKQAEDSWLSTATDFSSTGAYSYPRIAMAGVSCVPSLQIRQVSANPSVSKYTTGQEVYDWINAQLGNREVYSSDPTWAIVPRDEAVVKPQSPSELRILK